jgi:hypothetical protein
MIEVVSSWFLVKGNDHPHFHTRFVIGIIFTALFYSIHSTAVIPVNLKTGYESTVLSHGESVQKSAEIIGARTSKKTTPLRNFCL